MKRKLPRWGQGLAFAPLGFYYGFVSTALPILLAERHVPVAQATAIQATAFSPTFWGFLLSPILEIWLSRRQWSLLCVSTAAVCLCAAMASLDHIKLFTIFLLIGCVGIALFAGALGAWLSDVTEEENLNDLGAWSIVANLGAAGIFGWLSERLLLHSSLPVAAGISVTLIVLPLSLLFYFPDEAAKNRTPGEVFGKFWHDLKLVWGRRSVVVGMVAFLLPSSCFAMSNSFGLLGRDFHVSSDWLANITGLGVALVCSIGSLVGIPFCNRFSRRSIYLATGVGGAAFTLGLIFTAHTFTAFVIGVLGYSFIQGINYTAFAAWQFELVGVNNPQGALQFAAIAAAANCSLTYMTAIEGQGYAKWHVEGMLGIDAITSVVLGVTLLILFPILDRRHRNRIVAN